MPPSEEPTAERVVAQRYRLDRVLGRGAMGTVWAGYDVVLRRAVAVKEVLLPPGIPEHEADLLRERTLREARATAMLSHPNVVTLYDIAREGGEPFLVMELVPARSLAEVVRTDGPLDIAAAAAVADAVAAALEAAHRAGITHRDVKPGNVLVGDDGRIKLTDFGIARNVSEPTMTSGIVLGSPAFIAPEVASGEPATPSADLWGLGATLFAALEGRPPYDADGSPLATVHEVVHGEVPTPTLAGPLEEVVVALMVKQPAARMPLAEVRRRLNPLLPSHPAVRASGGLGHAATTGDAVRVASPATTATLGGAPSEDRDGQPPVVAVVALAAEPGPLPFSLATRTLTETAAVPRRRTWLSRTLVSVLTAVLFLSAAGTGFVLVRVASHAGVLPSRASAATAAPPVPWASFEPRTDTAAPPGGQGGHFMVKVPADWTAFREQRIGPLLPSTVVHFVAPDGREELGVERFPNFYPRYGIAKYVDKLRGTAAGPNGGFYEIATPTVVPGLDPDEPEPAREMIYRTVEGLASRALASQPELARTTFVRMLPEGDDLWVVRVTVPTDEERAGRLHLFDEIVPSFAPTP